MTKKVTVFTSDYYFARWQEVELQIAEEAPKLSGVARVENGEDQLDLEDRIAKLRRDAKYWKDLYDKAYDQENGISQNTRLRTFVWGS